MPFYDLNVPWSTPNSELPRTLSFLAESYLIEPNADADVCAVGYNVVALNFTITGKLPTNFACAIPDPLPFVVPSKLTVLRRLTLVLTTPVNNAALTQLASSYDILAVRPVDEKSLLLAATSLDSDIVSLDLTQRLPYFFRFKTLAEAVKRGVRFEVCYAQGVGGDAVSRRNLIGNVQGLIRASRKRGLIVSSGAASAGACRGPWDVINLASIWGLGQERGYEALSEEARKVAVTARLRRTSYRSVVNVVYGGEQAAKSDKKAEIREKGIQDVQEKRKVHVLDDTSPAESEKPVSKREQKRRRKAELEKHAETKGSVVTPDHTKM
ncbi:RNA-binding RNA processing protein rpp1 [Elasticomyces elasticus]|nr:RNA-binding RNA processing protein rpp1 [Elasticomyces elasticus]